MSDRPKVLVTADLSLCADVLERLGRVADVTYRPDMTPAELRSALIDYDAYYGHVNLRIDRELIDRSPRLRIVCAPSTGTDHLDVKHLQARGIRLISLTAEYELLDTFTATAEMAWALLLACQRRIPRLFEEARQGRVGLRLGEADLPRQLSRQTLGVIGAGRLGRMVVEFARSFRMRVLVNDVRKIDLLPADVQQVDFDTLIRASDVITLHVHLRDNTRHLIDRAAMARMKRGVTIVNTARGDLIDEQALLDGLRSGQIGAAGLDVVHDEWDANLRDRPLLEYARTHDNLILTPHVGGASYESIVEARRFIGQKLADLLVAGGDRLAGKRI